MAFPAEPTNPDTDLQSHYETYKGFVFWTKIFLVHVAVILLLLDYFFG